MSFSNFWGPKWAILGLAVGFKTVFGSTHVAKQLLFSFDFDLILGPFLNIFLGPNGLFLGSG